MNLVAFLRKLPELALCYKIVLTEQYFGNLGYRKIRLSILIQPVN
jgi:hypothetical protein